MVQEATAGLSRICYRILVGARRRLAQIYKQLKKYDASGFASKILILVSESCCKKAQRFFINHVLPFFYPNSLIPLTSHGIVMN